MALGDVDEFVVDELLTETLTRKDGGPPSDNMKRKCRSAIRSMLTYARRKRHYKKPMPEFFRLEGTGNRPRQTDDEYLTLEGVATLLAATRVSMHRAIFACAVGLGLRPNEASRMRWHDIDWQAGTTWVRGFKNDQAYAKVPLLPIARLYLEKWWEEAGRPSEGHCYITERGKPYSTEKNHVGWRSALDTAVKKSGIQKRVVPYTLRHTAATLLVQQGVSNASVAKLLRHSKPRMVEQTYDHTGAVKAPGLVQLAPTLPAG